MPSIDWILSSSVQTGERLVELYVASVPGGTLWKDVTSYTDKITNDIKIVSESMSSVLTAVAVTATQDVADGPAAPGAASLFSLQVGAQYNSILPTLLSGEQSALQLDQSARLLTLARQGAPAVIADAWPVYVTDGVTKAAVDPVSSAMSVNVVPESNIPLTLGALALPILINNLTSTISYDQVVSETAGNEEILTLYYLGAPVTAITLTGTNDGWVLNLGALADSALLLENGSRFELEDGTGSILLEA